MPSPALGLSAQGAKRDRAQPVVVLLLAFAQWIVTAVAATRIQFAVDDGPRSPVAPAAYAFAIWFAIFVLCSIFGVWQALPANAGSAVARRVGWPMTGAFATIIGWSIAVPLRLEWLSQIFLLGCWASLAVAYLRVVATDRDRPLSAGERWFVALPIAPFLGWVTAANGVSVHAQLVRYVGLPADGGASIAVGAALLLMAVGVGIWVLRSARTAPVQLWGAYGLTLVWALIAIVIEQRAATPEIAVIAGVGIVAVAAAAFGGGPGPRRTVAAPA